MHYYVLKVKVSDVFSSFDKNYSWEYYTGDPNFPTNPIRAKAKKYEMIEESNGAMIDMLIDGLKNPILSAKSVKIIKSKKNKKKNPVVGMVLHNGTTTMLVTKIKKNHVNFKMLDYSVDDCSDTIKNWIKEYPDWKIIFNPAK